MRTLPKPHAIPVKINLPDASFRADVQMLLAALNETFEVRFQALSDGLYGEMIGRFESDTVAPLSAVSNFVRGWVACELARVQSCGNTLFGQLRDQDGNPVESKPETTHYCTECESSEHITEIDLLFCDTCGNEAFHYMVEPGDDCPDADCKGHLSEKRPICEECGKPKEEFCCQPPPACSTCGGLVGHKKGCAFLVE